MAQASDSNYSAATRHLRPFRLLLADTLVADENSDKNNHKNDVAPSWGNFGQVELLGDDDIPVERHEAAVAPLLEEGELDADAIVVSPTTSVTATNLSERRRREEGWTDLGLEQFTVAPRAAVANNRPATANQSSNS